MASSQRTIDLHALRRIASQPKINVGAMIAPATKKSGNIPKKPNTRTKHTNQSDDPLTWRDMPHTNDSSLSETRNCKNA